MRYFRIVSFSGIETHRDDADRGSLRLVEGCIPHGQGGLRSAPVWEELGDYGDMSSGSENSINGADDSEGNSLLLVSRDNEVHDLALRSKDNAPLLELGEVYPIINDDTFLEEKCVLSSVGNNTYAFGDGSKDAIFISEDGGTQDSSEIYKQKPDYKEYAHEWSKFPKCTMFLVGPRKCLYAAGNPDSPLTVYITEPAGSTVKRRDSPHSTENTVFNPGNLSTVEILMSNASRITSLSVRGDAVIVHTDKGCHILYPVKTDQAETGFRVEQAPSGVFSASVNNQVVRGESDKKYWLGHDKQIYKDESTTKSHEMSQEPADSDQASAKAKGVWDRELKDDLTESFATYNAEAGMYIVYAKSKEYEHFINLSKDGTDTAYSPGTVLSLKAEIYSDQSDSVQIRVDSIESDPPSSTRLVYESFSYGLLDQPGQIFLGIDNIVNFDIVGVNLEVDSIASDRPSGDIQLGFGVPEFDFLDLSTQLPSFFPPGMTSINLDFVIPDIPGVIELEKEVTSGPVAFFEVEKENFDGNSAEARFLNRTVQGESIIAFYSWNFGNGNFATTTNPTQIYNSEGTFTVSLTAMDNDGRSSTYSRDVVISVEPPSGVTLNKEIFFDPPGVVALNAELGAIIEGSFVLNYFRNEGSEQGPYFTLDTLITPSQGDLIVTGLSGAEYLNFIAGIPEVDSPGYKAGTEKAFQWSFSNAQP